MIRPRVVRLVGVAAALSMAAGSALADAKVEEKSEFHLAGAVGALVNVFGGKAAREGVSSTTAVRGDRKSRITGSSGEIVDLKEEKVYHLDFDDKTYKVETFAEIRKRMEEQKARAEKQPSRGSEKSSEKGGPEYEVDFDIRDTGAKETINGFSTHQVIATATVHEKGKKIEESGGAVLTSDMWIGPKVAAMKEIADFDRRYFTKLYGNLYSAADMQQLAMVMATNPALAKAMKTFGEKKGSMEGTAIRTNLKFESVDAPGASKDSDQSAEQSASQIVGGLMGRLKKKQEHQQAEESTAPGRHLVFSSQSDVLKVYPGAASDDVSIPAGFKLEQ
jgi:hypothetical protein